ncbi:MAG: Hsp20/alpha crystallin family protein [Lachnospiraceae bacterium]|nr:Hsp20/alpha crystallin family protein [Lachnospiraceae bacterium]
MLMPSIFGENLLDDFFDLDFPRRSFRTPSAPANGLMKTDVKEKDGAFELSINLPGVKKEDIQAELKDGYLTISANHGSNKEEKDQDGRYIRRERYFGSASRSFYVGEDLTQEDIKAKYEDGVLRIDVPKVEPKKPEVEEKKYIAIEG